MKIYEYLKKDFFFKTNKEFNQYLSFYFEIEKFAKIKNKNLLDIGCADGKFLILCKLIGKANSCWGIDPAEGKGSNKNVLEVFQKRVYTLNLKNFYVIKDDILTHNFKNQKFDIITALYSIHHVILTDKGLTKDEDIKIKCIKLFKKINNLLNQPGIFIIHELSNNNIKIIRNWIRKITLKRKDKVDYKTKHSPKEYMNLLKNSGFEVIFVRYVPLFKKFKFLFSNPIVAFLLNSSYLIISIKK